MTPTDNTPAPMTAEELQRRRKNRWMLIGLFAFFMTPVLVALYLNSNLTDWKPGALNVNGELIQPVLPIPDADSVSNAPWTRELWTMLVVAGDDCNAACVSGLEKSASVHRALGRLQPKIQRALLSTAADLDNDPSLIRLQSSSGIDQLLADNQLSGELFLVDPFGNFMMRYAEDFDPSGLRKDLQRLLKHDYE